MKPHCIHVSSVIKRDEGRSKRKVFGQLKLLHCLNRQCLKLQKNKIMKGTRSSYRESEVLILMHVKHVFTAAAAGSIRKAQLTGGVQMKQTREGRRTLKSHRTAFTNVCDMIESKKSSKVQESSNFLTRVKFTYLLWKKQSTQNEVTKHRN